MLQMLWESIYTPSMICIRSRFCCSSFEKRFALLHSAKMSVWFDFDVVLKEALAYAPWASAGTPTVRLSKAQDGTEQADVECVSFHFPMLQEIFEKTQCRMPTNSQMIDAYVNLDVSHGGKSR